MYQVAEKSKTYTNTNESRYIRMATTGELRAIIEELQLIDAGEAAIYLGEDASPTRESRLSNQQEGLAGSTTECSALSCENSSCR
jgi:hypothetical protein